MRSSQSGLFILVDYPLTSNTKDREMYYFIYKKTYIFRNIGAWFCFCFINSHVCGQGNWFQNWSPKDFSINNHWTLQSVISRLIWLVIHFQRQSLLCRSFFHRCHHWHCLQFFWEMWLSLQIFHIYFFLFSFWFHHLYGLTVRNISKNVW